MEEVVQHVMKEMMAGDKVRIGFQGLVPVFSLSQALNLGYGVPSAHQFGSSFIHSTLKEKYPQLFSSIMYYKFKLSPHKAPCMDFYKLISTLCLVKSVFSGHLLGIASSGVLRTETGLQKLADYILCNVACKGTYQELIKKINWAEQNYELALNGIGPSDYPQSDTQSEIEEACGGYDNVHVDDPPSDQEAAQFVAKFSKDVSVSGKKHYLNLPDYSASKFAKVPESSSAGDVPAFYYDVYHRNTKDSNTFYEAFLRKDETERQDRLTKEKAERDERLRKEAQDKKENDEMREMLKNRIAELKEEKDQMNEMFKARIAELKDEKQELKDDVKRFFGVLEENKVLKQSLSDKESRLTSTQAQLRTATSDLNEQKGFYRELERDLLHVKQERDDLHASLVTYEDRPLGLPNKLIARGVM